MLGRLEKPISGTFGLPTYFGVIYVITVKTLDDVAKILLDNHFPGNTYRLHRGVEKHPDPGHEETPLPHSISQVSVALASSPAFLVYRNFIMTNSQQSYHQVLTM